MAIPTYERTSSASSLRMVEVGIKGLLAFTLAALPSSELLLFSPSCSFFSSRISSGVEAERVHSVRCKHGNVFLKTSSPETLPKTNWHISAFPKAFLSSTTQNLRDTLTTMYTIVSTTLLDIWPNACSEIKYLIV